MILSPSADTAKLTVSLLLLSIPSFCVMLACIQVTEPWAIATCDMPYLAWFICSQLNNPISQFSCRWRVWWFWPLVICYSVVGLFWPFCIRKVIDLDTWSALVSNITISAYLHNFMLLIGDMPFSGSLFKCDGLVDHQAAASVICSW